MGMDRLWAPWRMEFIRDGLKDGECFLCTAARSTDDAGRYVVRRGEHCFCLLNRYPYNNGHVLICPYRHVGELENLTRAELDELMRITIEAKRALDRACSPHGYNVGLNLGRVAGAGLEEHLHMHVVPRWSGDTSFLTTIGSTKMIPQALEEMWQILREKWEPPPAGDTR